MMRAVYKESEITPIAFDEAVKVTRAGLFSLTGKIESDKVVSLVVAKVTLESGRTGLNLLTSCHSGNVGNIKADADYEGMYTLYPCNEILNGQVRWFSPEGRLDKKGGVVVAEKFEVPPAGEGHPQCRFRAYANVVDGLYEYLDFIWREKYRDARDALLTGDAVAYVHALKQKGYFTADETGYAKGVVGLQAEFMARIEKRPAPVLTPPDVSEAVASQPFNITRVTALLNAAFAAREIQIVEENFLTDFDASEDEPTVVTDRGRA